jgi:acyl carrier protein
VVEGNLFEKVKSIIAKQLGLEAGGISLSTSFEDLGVDSLDLFRIVIEIEEEFGIQIEDPEIIKTVEDAVRIAETKMKKL